MGNERSVARCVHHWLVVGCTGTCRECGAEREFTNACSPYRDYALNYRERLPAPVAHMLAWYRERAAEERRDWHVRREAE